MKRKLKIGKKSHMSMPISIKGVDKENNKLTMVASTQSVDRHGDTVIQSGWDLLPFKKNPVILNSHNYNDASQVIARGEKPRIEGKGKRSKLVMDWVFAVDENPLAKVIFDLYAGKFLHASSVGFIPTKFAEKEDGSRDWFTIEEAELLEVSAVSVPANATALAKMKNAGVDVDALPEEMLDEEADIDEDDEAAPIEEDNENDETVDNEDEEVNENDDEEPTEEEPVEEEEDEEDESDTEEQDDEEEEAPEEEPEPEPAPKEASYNSKVIKAIGNIETKENRQLKKVKDIIQNMLDEDVEGVRLEKKTQEKIRKRKINKAIRALYKIK